MEAHESFQRFERVAHGRLDDLSRTAAIVVAVLAVFLAIATFLSNEAIKEAITGETKTADTTAVMEANEVKKIIAESNGEILRVVAVGNPLARRASAKAQALDARIANELTPIDRKLANPRRTRPFEPAVHPQPARRPAETAAHQARPQRKDRRG